MTSSWIYRCSRALPTGLALTAVAFVGSFPKHSNNAIARSRRGRGLPTRSNLPEFCRNAPSVYTVLAAYSDFSSRYSEKLRRKNALRVLRGA
jgi:hypothetical protein